MQLDLAWWAPLLKRVPAWPRTWNCAEFPQGNAATERQGGRAEDTDKDRLAGGWEEQKEERKRREATRAFLEW